jgi:tetratricopeptide (TPR) repeat protein
VSLNPDAPRAHYVLANVLLLRGDREGYFAAAERALALGGDRWIGGEIGYYFVWAGRPDLGAALLRRAIALSPATAPLDWFQALATAHIMKGEYEAALTELQKGLQPEYWWVVALEVAVYAQLGRMDEAIAARERMYALRPGIKIGDIVWIYRRFQRPDALSANFVEGFRKAGIPEGRYRPLDLSDTGQP